MSLRDTSHSETTATAEEVKQALWWAKRMAEQEALRVTRRASGIPKPDASSMRAQYMTHSRAICSIFERLGGNQPESLSWLDQAPHGLPRGNHHGSAS